ncbi:CehA/McbA family metallohydrolase [Halobacteriaceae archaeon GCM10025711]
MFRVDLHTHTRFFHGFPAVGRRFDPVGARLLGRFARARGLDAVVTTNHDYYRELSAGAGLEVIPGIEVTTTRGHLLVVGPDPPTETEPGALTPHETVALAHERDCAAIVAHPFRNSTVRAADAPFDAIEINGKGTESYEWVQRLARERDLPLVAGSDAHYPVEVGRAFTRVEADELTPESVVRAIEDRRVSAVVDRRPTQRLLRAAYRFIHGQKGWLERSDWDPPGIGSPPGEHDNRP